METKRASRKGRAAFWFVVLAIAAGLFRLLPTAPSGSPTPEAVAALSPPARPKLLTVEGLLGRGDTLTDIFKKEAIGNADLYRLVDACDGVQDLRALKAGRRYELSKNGANQLMEFRAELDDEWSLAVFKQGDRFVAQKEPIPYTVRPVLLTGMIQTHLVEALNGTENPDLLAIGLSEIFAWDIDFATDLREGDRFEMLVEELRYDDGRIRYGRILSAEMINNGDRYSAINFETSDGASGYFDGDGQPLRRGFLRSPLRYKYISSGFSKNRVHPILKISRPHLGVDYAAPSGTPVSASGDGTIVFVGRQGGYGKFVEIRHPGGYTTSYGHLSGFGKGIRKGVRVTQGQIVGYVGSTGLSTGPHLDYRVKRNGVFIDPLSLKAVKMPPLEGPDKTRFARERGRIQLLRAGAFLMVLRAGEDRGHS